MNKYSIQVPKELKYRRSLLMICVLIITFFQAFSQTTQDFSALKVGESPPFFKLNNIQYYKSNNAGLEEFKGKWLILDFWSASCSACIASFPKTNSLQRVFREKVQFMLIGYYTKGKPKIIQSLYEKCRERLKIDLPVVFNDSLFDKFDVDGLPFLVIINPEGMVKYITTEIDSSSLNRIISGQPAKLVKAYTRSGQPGKTYDIETSLLENLRKNSLSRDSLSIVRSILTRWDTSIARVFYDIPQVRLKDYQVLGVPLKYLYLLAYTGKLNWSTGDSLYGKFWPQPIFHINDTSKLDPDSMFCYGLYCNESHALKRFDIQKSLQDELSIAFGYKCSIEKRIMPYYSLVADEESTRILRSKGGAPSIILKGSHQGFEMINQPISKLIARIVGIKGANELQVIDETGIVTNIDYTSEAITFDDLKNEMSRRYGLHLTFSKKEMDVLIVSE